MRCMPGAAPPEPLSDGTAIAVLPSRAPWTGMSALIWRILVWPMPLTRHPVLLKRVMAVLKPAGPALAAALTGCGNGMTGPVAIGPVESERHARCTTTSETRCFMLGEALAPSVFLSRVRAHRGIGNSLHWVLDVTVNEDRQRTGEGNGAENMAMMRRMALNMAGGMAEKKKTSMRSRLERAGWNNDFLLEIIQVASCGMAEHEKIQER